MYDGTTQCISHKGFSGMRNLVARISVCNGGYVLNPHSLTANTLNRYAQ